MKIKIHKRILWQKVPIIQVETKKYCFYILFWVHGKWEKWQIKKGFYNKTFKFHPFEMTWYF